MRGMILSMAAATALVSGVANSAPVAVIKGPAALLFKDAALYAEGETVVVRDPSAKNSDFQDLYVVKTPLWFALPDDVAGLGEVIDFVPGQFAVMRVSSRDIDELSASLHHKGLACGVLFKLEGDAMPLLVPETPTPRLAVETMDERVAAATELVDGERIRATVEMLAEIDTRFHGTPTGRSVADLLTDKYTELKGDREDVTISTFEHSGTDQPSLVVRIEGSAMPQEVIVLGSHIDSVNWRDGSSSRAPGADDNASGTATNLEVFRALMASGARFERSIEIHGYAAEEIGLVGSQEIARRYRSDGIDVVAMMQIDMNLFNPQGTPDMIHFVTSNTHDPFNDQLSQLVTHYAGVSFAKAPLSGGSSDHASWTRQGFAAAFPFENPRNYNRQIHTAHDTIANSGRFGQAAAFGKLAVAYALHFGGIASK